MAGSIDQSRSPSPYRRSSTRAEAPEQGSSAPLLQERQGGRQAGSQKKAGGRQHEDGAGAQEAGSRRQGGGGKDRDFRPARAPGADQLSSSPSKVVQSALCLIPPGELWPRIQQLRAQHDKSFQRWPPHVNLLYPFVPEQDFAAAAARAEEALRGMRPFNVSLRTMSSFQHS
eukprot:647976-Hanusia_phi.AAC.1